MISEVRIKCNPILIDNQIQIHNKDVAELTVAKILGGGNCLLASIAHQMFQIPMRNELKAATIKLRKDILNNFDTHFSSHFKIAFTK